MFVLYCIKVHETQILGHRGGGGTTYHLLLYLHLMITCWSGGGRECTCTGGGGGMYMYYVLLHLHLMIILWVIYTALHSTWQDFMAQVAILIEIIKRIQQVFSQYWKNQRPQNLEHYAQLFLDRVSRIFNVSCKCCEMGSTVCQPFPKNTTKSNHL